MQFIYVALISIQSISISCEETPSSTQAELDQFESSDQAAAASMERGTLTLGCQCNRVGVAERVELRRSGAILRLKLLRHPKHDLLLPRHHRHLHAGRWRDAVGHGERIVLLIRGVPVSIGGIHG